MTTVSFCPACEHAVPAFAPGPGDRPGARCPACQALERHRFLCLLLRGMAPILASSRAILDVAPQPQVRRLLKQLAPYAYVGLDLQPDLPVNVRADLTRLPFRESIFDVTVCYHVLEHVPDDGAGMRELARTLAPGGFALIQVPRRQGKTEEDPSASVDERIRRFGQEDHVRYYGMDFEDRLLDAGLEPMSFRPSDVVAASDLAQFALAPAETVWICRSAARHPTGLAFGQLTPPVSPPTNQGISSRRMIDIVPTRVRERAKASALGPLLLAAYRGIRRLALRAWSEITSHP